MNIRNIRAALQSERKQSELQNLDDDFYERVGELLNELYEQRSELVEQTDDPFADAEIQEVNDEIETIQDTVESLYQRRSGKIVKKASFTAAGINEGIDGVTTEEEDIFNSLVTELKNGQDKIFNTIDKHSTTNSPTDTTTNSNTSTSENGSTDKNSKENSQTTNTEPATDNKQESWSGNNEDTDENTQSNELDDDGDVADFGDGSPIDVERMTVRIQHNIGEILGVDNRVYHLDEQDVVTLPETNAKTLINNEAATEIEQPENSK